MALTIVDRESSYTANIELGFEVDAMTVTLVHDWGGVIAGPEEPTPASPPVAWQRIYSEDEMSSSGIHKIVWDYTVDDEDYQKVQYVEVVQRYVAKDDFFEKYPELHDEFEPFFETLEARARKIIDTFCGQDFQYVRNATLTFEGAGTKDLFVGRRLDEFTSVLVGEDLVTDGISMTADDTYDRFIRLSYTDSISRSRFTDGAEVTVIGNWGWPYVPSAIQEAAEMMILELMNDDRINYTHGIDQIWMDTQRTEFKDGIFDTTGNLDIDTLLMDYTVLGWDYV